MRKKLLTAGKFVRLPRMRLIGTVVLVSLSLVVACTGDGLLPNEAALGPPDHGGATPGSDLVANSEDDASAASRTMASVDYLIVYADALEDSAARYAKFRKASGFHPQLVRLSDVQANNRLLPKEDPIRHLVRSYYEQLKDSTPLYVLLLGDAGDDARAIGMEIPVLEFEGITTDNVYADMDDDGQPEVLLGRIPAQSNADVDAVREKVSRYENRYEPGPWNRRINMFASAAGFGNIVDDAIEDLVFKIVEDIPYEFDVTMTYARQTSPYVYVPQEFSDKVYDRINEGSLLMAYIGHGSKSGFASLTWNEEDYDILNTSDLDKIQVAGKAPILSLIACLTGAFNGGNSIGEQIARTKGGPVAVLSSTEVSKPYANAVFIREFGEAVARQRIQTLGEAFVSAKRRMVSNDDALRAEIDKSAAVFYGEAELAEQRRTHLYMYTLFGDPSLRIGYFPGEATLTLPTNKVHAGEVLSVEVSVSGLGDGTTTLTLESKRRDILWPILEVPGDDSSERDDVIRENYEHANDKRILSLAGRHEDGYVSFEVQVPSGLKKGTYVLKSSSMDEKADASGFATIEVD